VDYFILVKLFSISANRAYDYFFSAVVVCTFGIVDILQHCI